MSIKRIFALYLFIVPFIVFGQDDITTKKIILNKLFLVDNTYIVNEKGESVEIISARLRGRWASIPLDRCFLQKLNSEIAAIAFEIYLSDDPLDYKNLIDSLNSFAAYPECQNYIAKINPLKVKLIQLVYFDLANKKFIAKPKGFPIELSFWKPKNYGENLGENDVKIKSFEKISNSSFGCKLEITEFTGDAGEKGILKVVRLIKSSNQYDLIASKDIDFFSLGGAIGCDLTKHYINIKEQGSCIIAEKRTLCDSEYIQDCEKSYGIKEGENNEVVTLLNF